ncbi:hypothetical protein OSTOST_02464 [Ostertagia ostertagi]
MFRFAQKRLLKIRTDKGICRSWVITFSIKEKDSDGIFDVNIEKEDGSPKKEVILGRDGVVRLLTYVGASKCIQHESYGERILWSDKFLRVLNTECDEKLTKLTIYSTYVRRDVSKTAAFYGVEFRICDVLKPVANEDIINRCRNQLLEDEERRFALTTLAKKETKEKLNEAPLGQAGFGIDEGPYSARVYDGMQQRKKFKIPKGRPASLPVLEQNVDLITPPLMLCVRSDQYRTEAWSVELGVIPVEETYRVHSPADPLAYTYWLNNPLEIELENPHVGKIEITQKDYNGISSKRVVAVLRFNKLNPIVPWIFVRTISVLAPNEDFPILSPDCLLSYHMRRPSQAIEGICRDQIRSRESDDFRPHRIVD